MPPTVEIFADVTCPFTHVGLRLVADRLTQLGAVCRVRAWPLEWVNGEPLAGDAEVLARIAREHGLEPPDTAVSPAVQSDYDEGRRRGVQGSPDFFVGDDRFFCPSLDIGHDDAGELVADLDIEGLSAFLEAVGADEAAG